MFAQLFAQIALVPSGVLTAVAAVAGAIGVVVAALLTALLGKLVVTPFLSARDKQDREVEWRKHAAELTKLDLERKLKSGKDFTDAPLRPSILDFLANYRDLQELGSRTPKALYIDIVEKRVKTASPAAAKVAALRQIGSAVAAKPKAEHIITAGTWIALFALMLTFAKKPKYKQP